MSADLYERDFLAWTKQQAAALRRASDLRINLPGVDVAHLAEEVEDMGNDTLDKIEGLIAQIVVHLFKLEFSPDEEPRRHWRAEIAAWRSAVRRRARRSPTALEKIDLDEMAEDAARQLRLRFGETSWAADCPDCCPYALADVLSDDFCPLNRRGLGEAP